MSHPHEHPTPRISLNDREQIQYLMGNPPTWMMRYGILVMAGVFSVLLTLSYFIHYPDVVEAKVVLTTVHPPIRVMAKSGGRVTELLVTDKKTVTKGQVLAVLENTANWHHVLRLETWLDSIGQKQNVQLPTHLHLGELQGVYSVFSQHWKDLDYFAHHNGVVEQINYLRQQITALQKIGLNLTKQAATLQQEFSLAQKGYERQRQLFQDKVIAAKEFEASETQYLAQKRQVENAEAFMLQNQMQIKQTESQINDLEQGKSDNKNTKELALWEDVQRLKSAISEWRNTYLIMAPISGQVSFSKIWSVEQPLNAGEEVLALVPPSAGDDNASDIIGRATVPALNSGKIQDGQKAIIRLDGYPSQQFGVIETTVGSISLLPQQQEEGATYLIDLHLPDTLVTSYGKTIPLRQEMSGQVRILTGDRRILERIFDNLRDLLSNQ